MNVRPEKSAPAASAPGHDRQRQADPEQPRRHGVLPSQRPEVDPGGVDEEHERQRRLGEKPHAVAGRRGVQRVERPGPTIRPIPTKTIAEVITVPASRLETDA